MVNVFWGHDSKANLAVVRVWGTFREHGLPHYHTTTLPHCSRIVVFPFGKATSRALLLGSAAHLVKVFWGHDSKENLAVVRVWGTFREHGLPHYHTSTLPHYSRIVVFPMEKPHRELSYEAQRRIW